MAPIGMLKVELVDELGGSGTTVRAAGVAGELVCPQARVIEAATLPPTNKVRRETLRKLVFFILVVE
jgi:hypothetical protein